ncbi:MAG: aminotransferase class V-fold PLP-dependent enzyme [Planctomycetota bacterium]|jgi:isopenicillin-N epimerase
MSHQPLSPPSDWALDPSVTNLDHGAFGNTPEPVREAQRQILRRVDANRTKFFIRDLEPMLEEARQSLAQHIGATPTNLVWVPNATAGVNTVLRSMPFEAGDELLVLNHSYRACINAFEFIATRHGATVRTIELPLPIHSEQHVVDTILDAVTDRTRLLLLDHITSPTGLILPIEPIVRQLESRAVHVLIDGAHGPGMVPLELEQLGASFYTGNCHKWICAPVGSAFLHVREDLHEHIVPLSISHRGHGNRHDKPRMLVDFDWVGTDDVSPYLTVPHAIEWGRSLMAGGWDAIRTHNRDMAINARRLLLDALATEPIAPESMLGSLATVRIPDGTPDPKPWPSYTDHTQRALYEQHAIEVPIGHFPAPPHRTMRISAQVYNTPDQYERLADALVGVLESQGTPVASAHA